ncbi:plasmid mobilization protein [Flavobacterium alkalisoli]|uniref:plasmid mobilization protein n=1 Tax=Flavobacterium alkalisoli TaxID=2602769 RepID=UPI003A8F1047
MKLERMSEEIANKVKWLHLRLSLSEHALLKRKQKSSTCRNLSQYVRTVLLDHPIVATYRNASQDDILDAMAILTGELNSIGNNINQTVKRLHTLREGEVVGWTARYASESQQLLNKIAEVKVLLNTMAERWLR